MTIKKEYIGATVYCKILSHNMLIEEGREKEYKLLGLDFIFEKVAEKTKKLKKK
jgi:hypothetical protein